MQKIAVPHAYFELCWGVPQRKCFCSEAVPIKQFWFKLGIYDAARKRDDHNMLRSKWCGVVTNGIASLDLWRIFKLNSHCRVARLFSTTNRRQTLKSVGTRFLFFKAR